MATILNVYNSKPKFPATDENPNAGFYEMGPYWVHAFNGQPTQGELASRVQARGQPIDPRIAAGPNADLEGVKRFLREKIRASF